MILRVQKTERRATFKYMTKIMYDKIGFNIVRMKGQL